MKYHEKVLSAVGYHGQALAELVPISDLLWKMDKVPLTDSCFVFTGSNYIQIQGPTKETYHAIIKALDLDRGEKIAASSGITITFMADGIEIRFAWDLPESCEVIYSEEEISEDEIVRTRKVVKEVICKEPLMQSVFPDWVEEENGITE